MGGVYKQLSEQVSSYGWGIHYLQFVISVKQSHHVYIVLYAIDRLKSSSQVSVAFSRITFRFSVIKQVSSVEIANYKISLLVGEVN